MTEPFKENDEPQLDVLLAKTPFHLPEGCGFIMENRNPSCSHAEIEMMIQKRTLNPTDMEIMKVLAAFPFLNHHNLRYALENRLPEEYRKTSYTDNLKKLKTAGIILCFCMSKKDTPPAGAEGSDTPFLPVSPLRLYILSQSAYTYMEKIITGSCPSYTASGVLMVRTAATCQFALHFKDSYRDRVKEIVLQKPIRNGKKARTGPVSVILLSVREEEDWLEKEAARIALLSCWLPRMADRYTSPVIIFCVEQVAMALSLHTRIQDDSLLALWEKYYCPDGLLAVYPPLKALYRCETDEQGKIRAIRLNT